MRIAVIWASVETAGGVKFVPGKVIGEVNE